MRLIAGPVKNARGRQPVGTEGDDEFDVRRELRVAFQAVPGVGTVGYFKQVFVDRTGAQAVKGGRKPPQSFWRRRGRCFRA
jgi:hypothetical protein